MEDAHPGDFNIGPEFPVAPEHKREGWSYEGVPISERMKFGKLMVREVMSGRTILDVAAEFGVKKHTVYNWMRFWGLSRKGAWDVQKDPL